MTTTPEQRRRAVAMVAPKLLRELCPRCARRTPYWYVGQGLCPECQELARMERKTTEAQP